MEVLFSILKHFIHIHLWEYVNLYAYAHTLSLKGNQIIGNNTVKNSKGETNNLSFASF